MGDSATCRFCGKVISPLASRCPHCGRARLANYLFNRVLVVAVIGFYIYAFWGE